MLTDLNLDDEKFEELVEEAKNRIASEYSEWTDFNYHDPGITISELFAFLKEIAQYRMNYIGESHKLKYLKLMGVEQKTLTPAKARVSVESGSDRFLPALTRFYASGICFESLASKYIVAGDIRGCIYPSKNGPVFVNPGQPGLKIPAFGKEPAAGSCFYLMFDHELPQNVDLSIFAEIYNGYRVKRNPLGEGIRFCELARLAMDYRTEDGWESCETFTDKTHGLCESGWLGFSLTKPMACMPAADVLQQGSPQTEADFRTEDDLSTEADLRTEDDLRTEAYLPTDGQLPSGYFIRLRLLEANYDIWPMLTHIGMNLLEVAQTRHFALCQDMSCTIKDGVGVCRVEANEVTTGHLSVLEADGDGWLVFENYTLERSGRWLELWLGPNSSGRIPRRIRLLSWELFFDINQVAGVGDGLPFQEYELEDQTPEAKSFCLMIAENAGAGADDEAPKRLVEWKQVADFSGSGPKDRHYRLDISRRRIIFGDSIRGMAPQGEIFICQLAACEGSRGNVKARSISSVEEGYEDLKVINETNAAGGCDLESLEDCFMDARRAVYKNTGLVTDEDYEEAVRNTPGLMIENCRVVWPEQSGSSQGALVNQVTIVVKPFSFEKNPRLSPEYMRSIAAWLDERRMIGTDIKLLSPEYLRLNVFVECKGRNNYIFDRDAIIGALNRYFAPFSSNFGKTVSQSEVYEILDRLEAVEAMEALSMDVTGNNVSRTLGGDIILPPNGLLGAGDIHYNINIT